MMACDFGDGRSDPLRARDSNGVRVVAPKMRGRTDACGSPSALLRGALLGPHGLPAALVPAAHPAARWTAATVSRPEAYSRGGVGDPAHVVMMSGAAPSPSAAARSNCLSVQPPRDAASNVLRECARSRLSKRDRSGDTLLHHPRAEQSTYFAPLCSTLDFVWYPICCPIAIKPRMSVPRARELNASSPYRNQSR